MADEETERRARRVYDRTRRTLLRRLLRRADPELDRELRRAAGRLRRRLRGRGVPEGDVESAVTEELDRILAPRVAAAERSIRAAAELGDEAARETVEAVLSDEAEEEEQREQLRIGGRATAMAAASERIRGATSVGSVSLSRRFHASDRRIRDELRRTLQSSIRAGEGLQRTAERILSLDEPLADVPGYVQDLLDNADPADVPAFREAAKRFRRAVRRLGSGPGGEETFSSLRTAGEQLLKDVVRAMEKGEHVAPALDRWLLERARYQARVIARHESVEAYRDSYRRSTERQPYVKGYRWLLSPRHPRPDVCDLLAAQDLHGLGPGGYPVDQVPPTPHPMCTCYQVAIIDRDHFRRELAARRGLRRMPPQPWLSGTRQTAAEWLAQQPEAFRRELLGPTRAAVFDAAPDLVLRADGTIRSARAAAADAGLETRQGPPRARGGLRLRPIVQRDRARMVRPFPSLRVAAAEGAIRTDQALRRRGLPAVGTDR